MTAAPVLRWISVFADVPAAGLGAAVDFWERVTGTRRGEPRGAVDEFVPLVPRAGDDYLWVQSVDRRTGGWHPDLHVADVATAALAAGDLGARVLHTADDLVTLESPAGQPFCLVRESRPVRRRPAAPSWPDGRHSLADQLCLDIPAPGFESECAFWSQLSGWPLRRRGEPVFDRLRVPPAMPVQILLQRLGTDDTDGARAHLDLSCDDRSAETIRHESHGATVRTVAEHWTILRDPAGLTYCITDRRTGAAPD